MKSIIPTIRKECKGLNLSEWPLEYQEKFFNEVAQDIWKEKKKTLKRAEEKMVKDKQRKSQLSISKTLTQYSQYLTRNTKRYVKIPYSREKLEEILKNG